MVGWFVVHLAPLSGEKEPKKMQLKCYFLLFCCVPYLQRHFAENAKLNARNSNAKSGIMDRRIGSHHQCYPAHPHLFFFHAKFIPLLNIWLFFILFHATPNKRRRDELCKTPTESTQLTQTHTQSLALETILTAVFLQKFYNNSFVAVWCSPSLPA